MTPGPDACPTGLATGDQREHEGGEDREKTVSRTQRESGSWSLKVPEGSRRQDRAGLQPGRRGHSPVKLRRSDQIRAGRARVTHEEERRRGAIRPQAHGRGCEG